MKKTAKRILLVLLILILCGVGAGINYVNDYYHAEDSAKESLKKTANGISVYEENKEKIIFHPEDADTGIIFYPGGKVQYEAYAPLMEKLAERGYMTVLLHMPGNLAVLDMKAADGVKDDFPQIKTWYLAGHSLGGSMAASYLSKHIEEYEGLILLASYSTADFSETDMKILSVYGSEDGVLNQEKYKEAASNLGADYEEHVIEGGCHAGFGSYGAQDGDGTPTISSDEQQEITADLIADFLKNK